MLFTVYFKLSPTAYNSPLFTASTDGSGNYSISLPPATWYVAAGADGYDFSADSTFAVSTAPVALPNIALTANPNWDVLFKLTVDGLAAIADGTVTGNRTADYPVGGTFTVIATPTVTVDGVKWESNDRDDTVGNDGYELTGVSFVGNPGGGVAANGASIVCVAQPRYTAIGGEARGEIVSLYFNGLTLCVDHPTGEVMISRKAWDLKFDIVEVIETAYGDLYTRKIASYETSDTDAKLKDGSPIKTALEQAFYVPRPYKLRRVRVWLKRVGDPDGNLTLKVYDEKGNVGTLS